jgi:hypothetical protein
MHLSEKREKKNPSISMRSGELVEGKEKEGKKKKLINK